MMSSPSRKHRSAFAIASHCGSSIAPCAEISDQSVGIVIISLEFARSKAIQVPTWMGDFSRGDANDLADGHDNGS